MFTFKIKFNNHKLYVVVQLIDVKINKKTNTCFFYILYFIIIPFLMDAC